MQGLASLAQTYGVIVLKLIRKIMFLGLLVVGISASANAQWEVDSVYRLFSKNLVPQLYETVEAVIKNTPCHENRDCILEQTETAYWLWVDKIKKSQQALLFPAAMVITNQISASWFSKSLREPLNIDLPENESEKPRVHQIIDHIVSIWSLAGTTNPSIAVVKRLFDSFLNCSMQGCEALAEEQQEALNLTMEVAMQIFFDCINRQGTAPGLTLRHLCDLIFNRPIFFEINPYTV